MDTSEILQLEGPLPRSLHLWSLPGAPSIFMTLSSLTRNMRFSLFPGFLLLFFIFKFLLLVCKDSTVYLGTLTTDVKCSENEGEI